MARPIVSDSTERLYASLSDAMTVDDEANNWAQLIFLESVGSLLQVIEDVVRDDADGDPGWSSILDLDRCPTSALGYLAQFGGVAIQPELDDATQRTIIDTASGRNRGTVSAIVATAQTLLTGAKHVRLFEREGSAYAYRVRTYAAETPDPSALDAAMLAAKPAGLVLTVEVATGMSYDELALSWATYDDMTATLKTYDELSTST